jgi:hypothetical protein
MTDSEERTDFNGSMMSGAMIPIQMYGQSSTVLDISQRLEKAMPQHWWTT